MFRILNLSCNCLSGCVLALAMLVSAGSAGAQSYTFMQLWAFAGAPTDGANPQGAVILDGQGNVYGTTIAGGLSTQTGSGTVFELTPPAQGQSSWNEQTLFWFCDGFESNVCTDGGCTGHEQCHDGEEPIDLVMDDKGNFYGTTSIGGSGGGSNCPYTDGCGVAFALTPPTQGQALWNEQVLHAFGYDSDGSGPNGVVMVNNNFYGATEWGGTSGDGTVFELAPNGSSYHVLYSMCSYKQCYAKNGDNVNAGLVADANGNLYGTTTWGGNYSICQQGCGTVFELSPPQQIGNPWTYKVIWIFDGKDGQNPYGNLIFDPQGNLYGTTKNGGGNCGCGIVFELTPPVRRGLPWRQHVIYSFGNSQYDASYPEAGVIMLNSTLYGTTGGGGAGGQTTGPCGDSCGTVYELTPSVNGQGPWTEQILYSFCSQPYCGDGYGPVASLVADKNGNLYGTTYWGGDKTYPEIGDGTVFELKLTQ